MSTRQAGVPAPPLLPTPRCAFLHELLCAVTLLACVCLMSNSIASAQAQKPTDKKSEPEKLAPYYPTPKLIVEKMLQLAAVKPGEKVYDVGSGDGRIVIMAAQQFQAQAVGVEIDEHLVKQSREQIRKLGLDDKARIVEGDLLQQDYSPADALMVYLLPSANEKLRPILERQLKNGTRIVAHDFLIRGWKPEQEQYIENDGEGRSHTLYLYVIHK